MKKVVGKIQKVVNRGYGLIKDRDSGVIFVYGGLPGEEIEVEIFRENKGYSFGRINKILLPSKYRVESGCPFFGECGGCSFYHIPYEYEIKLKEDIFRDLWREKIDNLTFIKSPKIDGYRIKAKFHVLNGILGFYRLHDREIVNILNCPLLHKKLNGFLKAVKNKEIPNGNLTVITNGEEILCKPKIFNFEKKFLKMKVGEYTFFLSPDTFSQANPYILPSFFSLLKRYISKEDRILEFHSGNGLFSVILAMNSSYVVSVENNKYSKGLFYETMKENRIGNFKFFPVSDKKFISSYFKREGNFNKIFLDPPRSGLTPVLRDFILKKKFDEILYLSCDISTQKRDVEVFLKRGYKIREIYLLDFFPKTFHIESFIVLKK